MLTGLNLSKIKKALKKLKAPRSKSPGMAALPDAEISNGINLNRIVKAAFAAAALIIAFSFFYRLVIFPHQNQKTLGACLKIAKNNYDKKWKDACLTLFGEELMKQYGQDYLCEQMTVEEAYPIRQDFHRQINDCLNRYPPNQGH